MSKFINSKIFNSAFIVITFIIMNNSFYAQVAMDGYFDDWNNVDVFFVDNIADGKDFDFSEIKITNDENNIYLNILFANNEFHLQKNNEIKIYIDCDNNSSTGKGVSNIGAEIEWNFGDRRGFYHNGSVPEGIDLENFRVKISPTYTAERFEVSIPRNFNNNLLIDENIKIVIAEEKDYFPDQNNSLDYFVDPQKTSGYSSKSIDRFENSHIRILTYNVYFSGPVEEDRKEYFERIIKAVKPDIIAFQEMVSAYKNKLESTIRDWLNDSDFNIVVQDGANMVASRFPILEQSSFISTGRISAVLLDTEIELGKNLLLLNTHLAYESDASRQADADETIMNLAHLKSGTGAFEIESDIPIIIAGDFNLSGSKQVLETFLTGDIYDESNFGSDAFPDWDNSGVKDLNSLQQAAPVNYTTARHGDGKIDYVFYTDSNLEIGNHFVLNTGIISDTDLQIFGLNKADTEEASDHLPTIFDLVPDYQVGVEKNNNTPVNFELKQNYPNPFNPITQITFSLPHAAEVNLSVYNIVGQKVVELTNQKYQAGKHSLQFNASNISSGMYFYKLTTGNFVQVNKMILLK